MYVSFYFPISDFRDLRPSKPIRNPTWPVFLDDAKPFQQNLGSIKKRPLGGIRGWVQEGVICEIGRSLTVAHQDQTSVRKRFYFDGSFSGYFSLGVSGLMRKYKRAYAVDDLVQITNDVLSRSVRSRHYDKVVPLHEYGNVAAKIYANGATSANKDNLSQIDLSRWVRSSRPLIIFEVPSDRLSSSLKRSFFFQSLPFMQSNVRFLYECLDSDQRVEFPLVVIEKNSRSEDSYARQARMVLARLYCEFCLLQDSVFFLTSNEALSLSREKGDYFCGRIIESLSRLTGAKRLAPLRDPSFYDAFTKVFLDGFDVSKIDALAHGLEIHGARRNLRQSLLKSHLWMRIANEENLEIVKEKIMGNKYENRGVVGAMGENPRADHSNFLQTTGVDFSDKEMSKLVNQLEDLKNALIQDGSTKSLLAAAAVSEAKESAEAKDGTNLASALRKAGAWAFDIATKIGVTVAAAAIKKSAGL